MKLDRGTIVLISLGPTVGHEQRGTRPCVVVSDPDVSAHRHFPMLCVLPLTSTPGEGAFYPGLSPGSSGLRKVSYALVDQIRSVDKRRVRKIFGRVEPDEFAGIDEGLRLFLGIGRFGL